MGFHRFRVNSKEKKKSKYIKRGEKGSKRREKVGGVDEIFSRSPHFQQKKKKKKTHDRNFHRAHETRKEVGLPTFIEKRNREGGL